MRTSRAAMGVNLISAVVGFLVARLSTQRASINASPEGSEGAAGEVGIERRSLVSLRLCQR
jgi:hypothetical protein